MHWSLRQVIGYWLWWRQHRLVASEKGRAPMDFPEFLQWVRLDLQGKAHSIEHTFQAFDGAR